MKAKVAKAQASETLQGIIEEALQSGADSIELEYTDGGLEITYMTGQLGLGHVLSDRTLASELLGLIAELARLENKSRGVIVWTHAGKPYPIRVVEYDSFGEPAFRLKLGNPQPARKNNRPRD